MSPPLKSPGTKRLKLKYDELLSNFAFNFNLRRYNQDSLGVLDTVTNVFSSIAVTAYDQSWNFQVRAYG